MILAALSPKYQAQFYGSHPDKGDVYVYDISAAAFNQFIKYLYLEEANFTLDNIEEILNIAKQCLVEHVVTKCGVFLKEALKMDNLLWIYRLANVYDIEAVRDLCEDRIQTEPAYFFRSENFLKCDHDTLLRILHFKSFNCREMVIIEGCISWGIAARHRKDLDAEDMKNVRNELGNAVFLLQFWLLTIKELVSFHKSREGLLTPDEYIEITYIMGTLPEFASDKFKEIRRKKAIQNKKEFQNIPKQYPKQHQRNRRDPFPDDEW